MRVIPLMVVLGLPTPTAGIIVVDVAAGWYRVGRGCCTFEFQETDTVDMLLVEADGMTVKEDCQRACLVGTSWCSSITWARQTHRCTLHAATADGATETAG